jgi:hypothetical protein
MERHTVNIREQKKVIRYQSHETEPTNNVTEIGYYFHSISTTCSNSFEYNFSFQIYFKVYLVILIKSFKNKLDCQIPIVLLYMTFSCHSCCVFFNTNDRLRKEKMEYVSLPRMRSVSHYRLKSFRHGKVSFFSQLEIIDDFIVL